MCDNASVQQIHINSIIQLCVVHYVYSSNAINRRKRRFWRYSIDDLN